jgi:hypothetical protein
MVSEQHASEVAETSDVGKETQLQQETELHKVAEAEEEVNEESIEVNENESSEESIEMSPESNKPCKFVETEQRFERLGLEYPDGDDVTLDILERPRSPQPPSFQETTRLFHITRPTTSTSQEEIVNSEKNLESILELDTGRRDAFKTLLQAIKYPKKDKSYSWEASLHAIGLLESMISQLRQFQKEDVKKQFHRKVYSYVTQADQCLKMLLEKVTLSFGEKAIEGPIENEALRKVSIMLIKLMIIFLWV